MKIVLLGKNGQVGHELCRTLLPLGEVIAIGRKECDLQDISLVKTLLMTHQPNVIVNAAAYTAVDKAEHDTDTAAVLNATLPQALAEYAHAHQCLLVHYSTDYVFDGIKSTPYTENDSTNPQSIYGASKRAGEEAIINSGCQHLIFRTSWVFSAHGHNFIKTILKLARERDQLRIVADQHGAPTSAELIADVTALAISTYLNTQAPTALSGLYHLTATGSTNWHHLACYTIDKALENGTKLKLTSQEVAPITTDEYPLPAKRPGNSRLDTTALTNAFNLTIPNWTVHLDRVINQLTQLEPAL